MARNHRILFSLLVLLFVPFAMIVFVSFFAGSESGSFRITLRGSAAIQNYRSVLLDGDRFSVVTFPWAFFTTFILSLLVACLAVALSIPASRYLATAFNTPVLPVVMGLLAARIVPITAALP